MSAERWAETVWYEPGRGAAAARAALSPLAALFRAGVLLRGLLYDAGVLPQLALPAPAISVGNLTVGGTGKTPVAAWIVAELAARGARPAVLLRGVGRDEAQVHALLNPHATVVADPDRVRGAAAAVTAGADVLVLDDAFQHRRARRDADVVLVAAEAFGGRTRLLPAGPYREPVRALRRADVVVVTRKSATSGRAEAVAERLRREIGRANVPVAIVRLAASSIVRWHDGTVDALSSLAGARVLAIAGIGAPNAFAQQLRDGGATVSLARYPDHHAYTAADAASLARRARGAEAAVTTLKDAVKLGPLWPATSGALWYVTQRVTVELGAPELARLLDGVAAVARARAAGA